MTTLRRFVPGPISRALRALRPSGRATPAVSSDYRPLSPEEAARVAGELANAWQSETIPAAQLVIVEDELRRFGRGEPVPVFDVFVDLLREIPDVGQMTLLEVGCSSGFYADVLKARQLDTRYAGCDYSPAFVDMARRRQPGLRFDVEDATSLAYPDGSFDIVVSGCCILHIHEYEGAIREASRVARRYILFHRTPVLHVSPTTHYSKRAYGVECVEIHFNETELLRLFREAGMRVVAARAVSAGGHAPANDVHVVKSYLCEKL